MRPTKRLLLYLYLFTDTLRNSYKSQLIEFFVAFRKYFNSIEINKWTLKLHFNIFSGKTNPFRKYNFNIKLASENIKNRGPKIKGFEISGLGILSPQRQGEALESYKNKHKNPNISREHRLAVGQLYLKQIFRNLRKFKQQIFLG